MHRERQWGNGIMVFVLNEYAPRITFVEISETVERIWALVHSDRGSYSACCCYRPPNPRNVGAHSFQVEYPKHKENAVGICVLRDLNAHFI